MSTVIDAVATAHATRHCWCRVLAGLCAVLALAYTGSAVAQTASSTNAASTKDSGIGFHFVFDASSSMCSYLKGSDEQKTLLTLIRFAGELRDVERNRRVVLIRQKQRQPSANDLVEAAAEEFQALAAAGPSSSLCAPLDGNFSNVAKVFDKPHFAPRPRSFVLVSDMVLKEVELTEFVDRFRQWARGIDPSQPYSAGLLSLGVHAAGRYFPVTDKANERRGYALPAYARPLHVLWFTVGDADQQVVRDMLKELGVQGGARPGNWLYGLQLLPVIGEDPKHWLTPSPPLIAQALFDTPRAQVVMASGNPRDRTIVQSCVQPQFSGQELLIHGGTCRDDKLLFDPSVDHVRIVLPLRTNYGVRLVDESGNGAATDDNGTVVLTIRRSTTSSLYRFAVRPAPMVLTDAKLRDYSADTDTCQSPAASPGASAAVTAQAAWTAACIRQLERKTYRYKALIHQLASRAEDVLRDRYAGRMVDLKLVVKR